MAGMLEYKCPCCDGAIQFDSATQKMKCPYCDTEFDVDTLKGYDEELKDEKPSEMEWATPGGGWAEGETAGLHTYSCKSCGGEIVGDDTMGASACPFCGNPIVLTGQFAGALRPDLIIPFKLDKKAAKAKLQEHLKGKTLLPRVFRSQNHIDEIKGVYVPFWLFDSDADAQLRFTATRTRCWSDDDYDYTETNYYSVRRDGTLGFDAVPVDGSSKIEDDLMESIEPFAMQDAIPFQTAYLAGYVADKYDVSAEDSIERANKRIRRSTEETFQQTVTGYDSVKVDNSSIQLHGGKAKYALFPVWLLSTSWRGENYLFAMNGQTGKFVGDLPVALAALVLAAALAVPAFAVEGGFADLYYRMNDSAGVLTEDEDNELEDALEELSLRQSFDVTIATVESLESVDYDSMEAYADDLYDSCQFGYGSDMDGVLLLVSVGDRKWHISTCGYGITAFTDAGIQYLGQQMTPFMADGDYAGAFRTFVQWSDTYIDAARAGHPYDVNNLPREPLSLMYLFLALGIGLVLAWVVVSVMKSQLRSVAFQENAASYVREGSMNLTNSRELFLYRDVQRTEHVEEKNSDSSGGSSTHTSSSGTTHGGGGGSF